MNALAGKRIVNTRAAHQAKGLSDKLHLQGAIPIEYPCIAIAPPDTTDALDNALFQLADGQFDWLILTSANTVYALAQRLNTLGLSLSQAAFRTAVIGAATAEATRELGLQPVDLPDEANAEALAKSLPIEAGVRVLLPESAIARPTLAENLRARGAQVMTVIAYQTVRGSGGEDVPHLLAEKQIDAITFTSSSTVTYFIERLHAEGGRLEDALILFAACIGAQTAKTARDCGFAVLQSAAEQTVDGLINLLDTHFAQEV